MSGVDVLAVMEEVLSDMARDGLALDMHFEGLDQARAAVAELIEAADDVFHNAPNGPYMGRLAEALDFVTGEAS